MDRFLVILALSVSILCGSCRSKPKSIYDEAQSKPLGRWERMKRWEAEQFDKMWNKAMRPGQGKDL